MIQVTYISTPTRPMRTEDFIQILSSARANNIQLGVSGMLLFTGSEFIQTLEGDEKHVDELLAKIKQDSRHENLRILERKTIAVREYADWTMGFKRVGKDDLRDIPGLNKLFDTDLSGEIDQNQLILIHNLLSHFRNEDKKKNAYQELSLDEEDKFILFLHATIRFAVKVLSLLMMLTVLWCVVDVVVVIYRDILSVPIATLSQSEILHVFGSFMLVLIAIEIFINITVYIRNNVIPIKMIVATALMAIARKIIVLDYDEVSAMHIIGTAALVIALGGSYWLLEREFKICSTA